MFRQKFLKNPPLLTIGDPFQFLATLKRVATPSLRTATLRVIIRLMTSLLVVLVNHLAQNPCSLYYYTRVLLAELVPLLRPPLLRFGTYSLSEHTHYWNILVIGTYSLLEHTRNRNNFYTRVSLSELFIETITLFR
jgi:hypothetical protein